METYTPRQIEPTVKRYLKQFRVLSLTGPRQSGKTTLLQNLFPERNYLNLEDPDTFDFAKSDPRGFLRYAIDNDTKCIIDEAQRIPELFSYIQGIVDTDNVEGQFILSGSQNFLLMESISQSLAGRVGVLNLLPLTFAEIPNEFQHDNYIDQIYTGFYPDVLLNSRESTDWYNSYIETYLERDVRQIVNVSDLRTFRLFMKMCAARSGQLLNFSSLANDCGVALNTVKKWISVLETSFVIQLVYPYHKNYGKRLVKTPKLHFIDTGLAATLLSIRSSDELQLSVYRGGLFESYVTSQLLKCLANLGQKGPLYFWRDRSGNEVDLILEKGSAPLPIEIKSGMTITGDLVKPLNYFSRNVDGELKGVIIYGGDDSHERSNITVKAWSASLSDMVEP